MNVWIFDSDGTLYDDREAYGQFRQILSDYVSRSFNVAPSNIKTFLDGLKSEWETSSAVVALMREFNIEFSELVNQTFLSIDLKKCPNIVPNTESALALRTICSTKVVLTNNPSAFAEKVLRHIGLFDLFDEIIGIEKTQYEGKPKEAAYRAVEQRFPNASSFIFCDNSLQNLEAAQKRGWQTIWFQSNSEPDASKNHRVITNLSELKYTK